MLTLRQISKMVGIATLLLYGTVVSAIPSPIIARPVYMGLNDRGFSRRASTDLSCPDGFLCNLSSCPVDVVCPNGMECVDFEGTLGCATPDLSWCALNPSTFEAVGCDGGSCCHGNCYVKDSVCCDNAQVKCTIGEACNVCPAGETCKATGCSGPAPTSTAPPPRPSATVVPSVGNFKDAGCFSDATASRVLVADQTTDSSSNGMTVEKCVAFAQNGAWQFAGVEFGSQCFVGNTLHNAAAAPSGDCNQPCAGNGNETCGSGNRIEVYKDSSWVFPQKDQLEAALLAWNSSLADALQAADDYRNALQDLQASQSSKRLKARDVAPPPAVIARLKAAGSRFKQARTSANTAAGTARRIAEQAVAQDIEEIPLLNLNQLQQAQQAVDTTEISLTQIETVIDAEAASINANPTSPNINAAGDLATLSTPVVAIGIPGKVVAGIGAASGVFLIILGLVGVSTSSPPQPSPPQTNHNPEPTATASATSTTSLCTLTATPTPIIIVTTSDTTAEQFDKLVGDLPKTAKPLTFTNITEGHWWLLATLDQCDSEALWDNPNVQAMAIDNYLVGTDNVDPITVLPSNPPGRKAKRNLKNSHSESPAAGTERASNITNREAPKVLLDSTSHILAQTNAADNLNWISGLSFQGNLQGSFFDIDNFMYDDGKNLALVSQPWIYYIDPSGFAIHWDYAPRIGLHTVANIAYNGMSATDLTPTNSHGTSMASCAAGSYAGPAKSSMLGLLRLQTNSPGFAPISSTMLAFDTIISHSLAVNSRGRSVVAMSFGAPVSLLWWPNPTVTSPRNGLADATDVFGVKLQDIYQVGIAAVKSAGNTKNLDPPRNDLSFQTPGRNGGTNTPLIVVGNNQLNNVPYSTSTVSDSLGKGILSLYAVGTDCVCGAYASGVNNIETSQNRFDLLTTSQNNGGLGDQNGSSQSTAQTAGVIANMLMNPAVRAQLVAGGLPNFAMAVKTMLLQQSNTNKGTAFPDGIPRLSNNIQIPCTGQSIKGRPIPPAANLAPVHQTALVPVYKEAASGTTVTFSNPPQCYNLN